MTADIAYVNDDGVTVAQLEAVTQARAERDAALAEVERLRRRAEEDSKGLDRWCNYQDRLFAVMSADEIRAFDERLTEGGWTNDPLCRHEDERDSARRWVVNLESRIARAREIAADNDMNPSVRSLLLAVLDGECEHQWRSHVHLGLHRWFECSECGAKR